jgi:hypothetical protein
MGTTARFGARRVSEHGADVVEPDNEQASGGAVVSGNGAYAGAGVGLIVMWGWAHCYGARGRRIRPSIDVALPLADVYDRVEFAARVSPLEK